MKQELRDVVQKLLRLASHLGDVATRQEATLEIRRLLDGLEATTHFGFTRLSFSFPNNNQPSSILFANAHRDQLLEATVIYFTRPGARVPLHDHPNMHGFIKVLNGSLQVSSYTPIGPTNAQGLFPVVDEGRIVLRPSSSSAYLEPVKGNIHEADTFVFDVLVPPYANSWCDYFERIQTNEGLFMRATLPPSDYITHSFRI